ncbi:hypothetical protein MXD62_19950 [Frankia sp. Mgl5]|uniref:hypothetical protein n=1 Tax=Frankia sp. Mgl5 TaxID=2933793 RepID=UPI00200CD62D|nr:hypothetical protein [Frankia sp. Mgl5]MCK9929425.1 hypothetical protein [Frankia sp. Mgl5]
MGFIPDEVVYNVDFSDTKLAGLEISLRELSTDELLTLGGMAAALKTGEQSASDLAAVDKLLTSFADVIVSWNLETKNGGPEPVSRAALGRQSLTRFVMPVLNACLDAINGVDEDLGKDSASGSDSLVGSLPMEPLSVNLPS